MLGRNWAAIVLICAIVTPAAAQERTAVRNGFDVTSVSGKTILLMRPSIRVGAQSTGGLFEPNAGAWSAMSGFFSASAAL